MLTALRSPNVVAHGPQMTNVVFLKIILELSLVQVILVDVGDIVLVVELLQTDGRRLNPPKPLIFAHSFDHLFTFVTIFLYFKIEELM